MTLQSIVACVLVIRSFCFKEYQFCGGPAPTASNSSSSSPSPPLPLLFLYGSRHCSEFPRCGLLPPFSLFILFSVRFSSSFFICFFTRTQKGRYMKIIDVASVVL
ncbi:unnamed protein product [Gadus morhua 'NCC']